MQSNDIQQQQVAAQILELHFLPVAEQLHCQEGTAMRHLRSDEVFD